MPAAPDLRALRAAEDRTTPERPTIAAIVERYLEWKARTASRNTHRTYTDGLRRFAEFLTLSGIDAFQENADVLPVSVLDQHILWLRDRPSQRSGRPLAQTAIATYHAAVLDCFKWAASRKLVSERFRLAEMGASAAETLGKVHKRSARHDRRIPLLVAYVDNLPLPDATQRNGISRIELLRNRALLHLLFSSGMRREEVLTLNRADLEGGWASSAIIVGKGSKERTIFWDEETRQALQAYLLARHDHHEPIFIRLDNRRGVPGSTGEHWRLTPQSAWEIVRRYSKETGIPATPHGFRHAWASSMINNGAPLSLIGDLLGHADVSTTKTVYAAYEKQTLRKGFDQFNRTASEQAAELEAEQERRTGGSVH